MDLHLRGATPTPEEKEAVDALLGPPTTRWEDATLAGIPTIVPDADTAARDGHAGSGHGGNGHGGNGQGPADLRTSTAGQAARARRHLLLPALHAVNDAVGWVSEGALEYICGRLTVPPAEAYGVATFYALFSVTPRPPRIAHVCEDLACRAGGADDLIADLEEAYGPPGPPSDVRHGEAAASGADVDDGAPTDGVMWERSPCLGLCERAPAVWLQRAGEDDAVCAPADVETVARGLAGEDRPAPSVIASVPQVAVDGPPRPEVGLRFLARVGRVDPTDLDAYRAAGGYQALRTAVGLGPRGALREVKDSALAGRGGAAFPLGIKWEAVASAPEHPHYVVANADESEPGTFKDRVLMEEDPFAVVESMTLAGFVTGSELGYVYLRGEYPLAHARLEHAIEQARERGFLGRDVMGEGFAFDLEIRRGGAAYICGEETALLESIEGKRGEPRQKPPFPTQVGLFAKPTAINNIETLVAGLHVLTDGGPGYASIGTDQSTGTKLFCVSGSVRHPGLYEVTFGATVREVLDLAGGVPGERSLQAVLLGGAAGTFLRPDQLDTPLTFEGTKAIGQALGSGVVMAFDESVDLLGMLGRVAAFFRDESCGQCVPCRVGTVRQEESLARIADGADPAAELELLDDVAQVMADASICGLGHTAPSALRSALSQGLLPFASSGGGTSGGGTSDGGGASSGGGTSEGETSEGETSEGAGRGR
ncbi:NADH-quinone oxidoreductase subunit E [Egibacter rhizosphaerae]|uniref:NADH-quinone oxidoreductase subunit E n=1 Tax=Egibacter rhizosphaerae TaxID=1670831 RepID=A0A411YJE7_9ACTN|nr:NADH-ubiquinone oxidoreductase-F iron-sulfur binding region domain-containing protein [Egibacter rhizosphaerae]QBI21360.1 NADH-quinone oxidoreductase subunit E [Egibacter rhizosphaerae]